MLDPWIIEEIRRREEERRRDPFTRIEVPIERPPDPTPTGKPSSDEDPERGVVVIDL